MQSMVPLYGFGGGGGAGGTLTVTAPAGCTVTVSRDGKSKTKTADSGGVAVFKGLSGGEWTVTITDGTQTAAKTVTVTTDYITVISFSTIPEFTYTGGDFEIVNDADEPITASQDNWKIRFLTSGTLVFTALNGAENGIDVFCVGGGANGGTSYGGGGGGGYTTTGKAISVQAGYDYPITIGVSGGETSGFGVAAAGGISGSGTGGGNGGSGGGTRFANGGADGSDGAKYGSYVAGVGQGTNTREFGEETGRLYAGGGGGGSNTSASAGSGGDGGGNGGKAAIGSDGLPNTGGGGGGGSDGGLGGSGIVVIRNTREVA